MRIPRGTTGLLFCSLVLAGCSTSLQSKPAFAATTSIEIDAKDFDRYQLTPPDAIEKIRQSNNHRGLAGADGRITGWVEYDFTVGNRGWYELVEAFAGGGNNVEFIVDPGPEGKDAGFARIYGVAAGFNGKDDKLGNIWLDAGPHVLRIQQYYWTGFPKITHLSIRPSPPRLAARMRADLPDLSRVYRTNECPPLGIIAGSAGAGNRLTVLFRDMSSGAVLSRQTVSVPASQAPHRLKIPLYCEKEGRYSIGYQDSAGRDISNRNVREIGYEVIDTRAHPRVGGDLERKLVEEIDFTVQAPDYFGGGETRVITKPFGTYRESGDVGWKRYQELKPDLRAKDPEPSWFAYKLRTDRIQHPYLVEVDYPDDALRTMAIALRESVPLSYPVAGGVDTGGEFPLSNEMQTESLIFWPRAPDPRIVFMNARYGSRAAAARIRIYQIDDDFPALLPPTVDGRDFSNWYEEGTNFTGLYGVDESPGKSSVAIDRWAESVAYMGGNVLSPTVSIYGFCLYPSRFNQAFSEPPGNDVFRRILLIAEKHGLKVLPDFHPRADELARPYAASLPPKPNLLVSKDGRQFGGLPPYYNPIYPANQDWYVNMLGEIADKYKDSPALLGVSLRLMQWKNPALNNFASLDWGYGDYTIALFQQETGIVIPEGQKDDGRYRRRYDWLMANAKAQWIDWRCKKIAQLYTRIRDRIRKARPDLKVYSVAYDAYPSGYGAGWLREAGVDAGMLSRIDGVVLINGLHAYGRLYDDITTQGTRDNLLDPAVLNALVGSDGDGRFQSYARYFEATEIIVPPEAIGFGTSRKKAWTSAVVNPAGRNYLERYAIELAETNAVWLGDGGNGYTLGQPLLREFLREYRLLPAVPFKLRQDARDPVAVWELARDSDYLFYAVNREPYGVAVRIGLRGTDEVSRLSTGETVKLLNGALNLQLKPFQLLTFKSGKRARIEKVSVDVPNRQLEITKKQVAWLGSLNDKARNGRIRRSLSGDDRRTLARFAGEAHNALARGWVWRANSIIEDHELLKIYTRIGEYPPDFGNYIIDDD